MDLIGCFSLRLPIVHNVPICVCVYMFIIWSWSVSQQNSLGWSITSEEHKTRPSTISATPPPTSRVHLHMDWITQNYVCLDLIGWVCVRRKANYVVRFERITTITLVLHRLRQVVTRSWLEWGNVDRLMNCGHEVQVSDQQSYILDSPSRKRGIIKKLVGIIRTAYPSASKWWWFVISKRAAMLPWLLNGELDVDITMTNLFKLGWNSA